METEQQKQAHKELHKKIYDCGCCPISPKDEYCGKCERVIIDFMNKYGAGVLTRDELIESLRKLLGEKIHQLALLDENTRKQIRKLKKEIKRLEELDNALDMNPMSYPDEAYEEVRKLPKLKEEFALIGKLINKMEVKK